MVLRADLLCEREAESCAVLSIAVPRGRHQRRGPVDRAKAMVSTFPNASIDVIERAGLFSHEEAPADVAASLLPTLATPLIDEDVVIQRCERPTTDEASLSHPHRDLEQIRAANNVTGYAMTSSR